MKLCQRAHASCGACCGIYNRSDLGRAPVRAELARHTRVLARVERTLEGFRDAAARLEAEAPPPLFPSIRVCQLAGFLDEGETRIGCLAHPKATGGIDLRSCGVYDVETCEAFLCPSHARLTEREAVVVEAATDFYLYGLVATDAPFVRAVLQGLEAAAPGALDAKRHREPRVVAALRRLFELKEELAPASEGIFGAFRHRHDEPPEAAGPEAILAALGADERSGNDADLFEAEVRERFAACLASLRRVPSPAK